MFCNALLLGRARLNAMAANVRHGAPGARDELDAQGRIQYPQCRSGVYPPTVFDPALVKRSAQQPEAQLELAFVYGYGGDCLSNNLRYVDGQNIVYFTAGVGIVYNRVTNLQQFFRRGLPRPSGLLARCLFRVWSCKRAGAARALLLGAPPPASGSGDPIWDSNLGIRSGDPLLLDRCHLLSPALFPAHKRPLRA